MRQPVAIFTFFVFFRPKTKFVANNQKISTLLFLEFCISCAHHHNVTIANRYRISAYYNDSF